MIRRKRKIKRIIFLSVLVAIATILHGQTYIPSGHIQQTHWSYAGSPYIILGDIEVPVGQSLTIEPGVEILFQGNFGFTISGTINAVGTTVNNIIFTGFDIVYDLPVRWKGISLVGSSGSIIDHTQVSYVGVLNTGATLRINSCNNIEILNSKFFNSNVTEGNGKAGLEIENSNNISIVNNTFTELTRSYPATGFIGVIRHCYNLLFHNNTITDNSVTNGINFMNTFLDNQVYNAHNQITNNVFNNNSSTFAFSIVNNETSVTYTIESNIIDSNDGNDWSSFSRGLSIHGQNITVRNNTISNNNGSTTGGGINVVIFENSNIYPNILIEDNKIFGNTAVHGGGIYIISYELSNFPIVLRNNQIYENHALQYGGAIYIENSRIANTYDYLSIVARPHLIQNAIYGNKAQLGAGIYLENSEIAMINNIIVGNQAESDLSPGHGIYSYKHPNISLMNKIVSINNIFWDNDGEDIIGTTRSLGYDMLYIRNSTFEDLVFIDNFTHINTMDVYTADPQFSDDWYLGNADYGSLYLGLGTGEPDDYADYVGLYPCEIETHERTFREGMNWVSFPVLTRNPNIDAIVEFSSMTDLLDPYGSRIWQSPTYLSVYDELEDEWDPPLSPVKSTMGYKIEMSADTEVVTTGTLLNPNTPMTLLAGQENWVGYFLPYEQNILDAISGLSTANILYMKYRDYFISFDMINISGIAYSSIPVKYTLKYGDMLIIKPKYNTVLTWNTGPPSMPSEVVPTEVFTFVEKADYVPLFVEINTKNPPTEVGAFIDKKCVGATVYEGVVSEMQLYIGPKDIGKEIEIYFYYEETDTTILAKNFAILDIPTEKLVLKPFIHDNKQYYYYIVYSPRTQPSPDIPTAPFIQLHQNYPNPFNPETRIDFYLSHDDDIKLTIYNIKGQKVRELYSGFMESGTQSIIWDSKDSNEISVSSGVYLYKLETSYGSVQRRMMLVK